MPRRLVALATALAVLWTALWPLVSSAHSLGAEEPMPLCHQAGMQVSPDIPAPADPRSPKEAKQHCPLCVMAFFVAFQAPPLVAAPAPLERAGRVLAYFAPAPDGIAVHLPQSRAPPAFLPI
jgi:hypothetical protein